MIFNFDSFQKRSLEWQSLIEVEIFGKRFAALFDQNLNIESVSIVSKIHKMYVTDSKLYCL